MSNMDVWLCPVRRRSWNIVRKFKVFGAPRQVYKLVSQVKVGDLLLFHLVKSPSGIIAVGKVTSEMFEDEKDLWEAGRYPLRVNFEIIREFHDDEKGRVPLGVIMTEKRNPEIEVEPYLGNVWITRVTKKQFQTLERFLMISENKGIERR